MIESIIKADKEFNLFGEEKNITVAVSGGADSVALLHGLYSLKDRYGFVLTVAHFHHGIRGSEADRDLRFVKKMAEDLKLSFVFEKGNAIDYSKEKGMSLETAARELRYDFLRRVSNGVIATAHSANDNIETVIFNIIRGTSLNGMKGIPPKRDNIIRPLILCERETIEKYCLDNNLSFVTDSTNLTDDCTRNIIRHKVVPVLKELNSACVANTSNLCRTLYEDNSFIEQSVDSVYKEHINGEYLDISNFSQIHPSIAKRLIIKFYKLHFGILPDSYHIEQIYDVSLGKIKRTGLSGGMSAVRKSDFLFFEKTKKSDVQFSVKFRTFTAEKFKKLQNVHELLSINALDYDKIIGEIRQIPKSNSDKIRKSGVTKTVKKILTENKIPLEYRNNLPVFADDNGIIWIYNIGAADRVKVDKSTKVVLLFEAYKT